MVFWVECLPNFVDNFLCISKLYVKVFISKFVYTIGNVYRANRSFYEIEGGEGGGGERVLEEKVNVFIYNIWKLI